MSKSGQLSVQDIKGRFESLPDFPVQNNDISSGEHRRYQKRNGIKVSFPSERCRGVQKDEDEEGLLCEENVSSRLRSLSVGTASPRGVCKEDNEKVDISKKKVIRNHSFNKVKQFQNGKLYHEDESPNCASYNFSSFAEKQKLVENIVMNIRNNAKKSEEEFKRKDSKTRDIFSITSKLEKDLKNVIEKGSRLKWNSKSSLNKSHFDDKGNEPSGKFDSSSNGFKYELTQNHYSETNSETVRLLSPFRTYSNDALDAPDKENKFTGFRSRSSPDLLRKSNKDKARLKCSEESIDDLDCSQSSNSSQSKDESSHGSNYFFPGIDQTDFDSKKSLRESSPVRPPRRTKKKKAPLPPLLKNNCHESSYAKENFKDCNDGFLYKREGKDRLFKETDDKLVVSNSTVVSHHEKLRNSLYEGNNDFNYEEQCEKSLEGDQFLHNKLTASVSLDSSSSHLRSADPYPSGNNKNKDNLQLNPLPMGSPPKKPPRTFAYDIYHSMKVEGKKSGRTSTPPTKLTEEEIESLYSKPIKRLKDKSVTPSSVETSSQSDEINGKTSPSKPMIAPKPPDLMNKSKKRFSAVEPLTQNHKEFADEKSSIKRNSSFRFSFKKNSKSTGHLNNAFICISQEDSVVYATPVTNKAKAKESPKELHYMCSPLFEDKENDAVHHKENRPPSSPVRGHSYRPGLMDGLREELRQSCRFVQKRLKSTPNGRRKYKNVTTPRH
ncbi:hypothetical protein Anas_09486 [Armadillidium nasatum]|uniref:Uncharacterized protein n=1 Tax=Armadillidium nasatum TaxID=96803 RepID=A0A5N5SIF8_9CRUS|nr:hypothetical protein Anas_09486 [Armadillidium nasatum]